MNLSWERRFRVRQHLKGSLWVVPLVGAGLGVALSYASVALDNDVSVPSGWDYSPGTALSVLTTVVAATAALTGFVVTVSVLVVQMATGTFSARYMRIWYRDAVLKATLATLLGTLMFSYALLRRINDSVPDIGVTTAGFLLGAAIVLFLVFLDRSIQRLRPVKVAALVAEAGRRTAEATAHLTSSPTEAELAEELLDGEPTLAVRTASAGSIQAIDRRGLVAWAERHDCVLVLPEAVGDFVSTGTTLVEVFGGAELPPDAARPAPQPRRARDRADDRPGRRVRAPGDGRHRDPRALAGGERPDDRGPGPRPPRRDAGRDRADPEPRTAARRSGTPPGGRGC